MGLPVILAALHIFPSSRHREQDPEKAAIPDQIIRDHDEDLEDAEDVGEDEDVDEDKREDADEEWEGEPVPWEVAEF